MDDLEMDKDEKDLTDDGELDDLDDPLLSGKKRPKAKDDDLLSLDDMADDEDGTLDDDKYDDEDLW